MTTSFDSVPIIDLAPLSDAGCTLTDIRALSEELGRVFETVGFAYLVNAPVSFSHHEIFELAQDFFRMDDEEKMKLAKTTFRKENPNTYRGYFPAQKGSDNLKEGFELGSPSLRMPSSSSKSRPTFVLTEANIWPSKSKFPWRGKTEHLHHELQSLSSSLLVLLAMFLGKEASFFTSLLTDSVSTLRLLHYPAIVPPAPRQELNCTPHTDSGLVTLLLQDATGGLEVLNSTGDWIPAPPVPGSIVVNIGDLMAQMSGGRFVATYHRVRSAGTERYSVPFFCEPGVDAMVGAEGNKMSYQQWVLGKMGTWVEFQDTQQQGPAFEAPIQAVVVET